MSKEKNVKLSELPAWFIDLPNSLLILRSIDPSIDIMDMFSKQTGLLIFISEGDTEIDVVHHEYMRPVDITSLVEEYSDGENILFIRDISNGVFVNYKVIFTQLDRHDVEKSIQKYIDANYPEDDTGCG